MKIAVILLFMIPIFAGERNLFSSQELEKVKYYKSNGFILENLRSQLRQQGTGIFKATINATNKILSKEMSQINKEYFDKADKDLLYERVFKLFLEE